MGMPFYWFGIQAAIAVMSAYAVIFYDLRRRGLSTETLPDFSLFVFLTSLLGARVFFLLTNLSYFYAHPLEIFQMNKGGLIQWGGILAGIGAGALFVKIKKLSFTKYSDAVALGLPLGFGISRIGCLMAGCCYGRPTSMPWSIVFNNPHSLAHPLGVPLHPVQIYSSIGEFLIFGFLLLRRKKFDGELFLIYLILESFFRLVLDFFRVQINFSHTLLLLGVGVLSCGVYIRRFFLTLNRRVACSKFENG